MPVKSCGSDDTSALLKEYLKRSNARRQYTKSHGVSNTPRESLKEALKSDQTRDTTATSTTEEAPSQLHRVLSESFKPIEKKRRIINHPRPLNNNSSTKKNVPYKRPNRRNAALVNEDQFPSFLTPHPPPSDQIKRGLSTKSIDKVPSSAAGASSSTTTLSIKNRRRATIVFMTNEFKSIRDKHGVPEITPTLKHMFRGFVRRWREKRTNARMMEQRTLEHASLLRKKKNLISPEIEDKINKFKTEPLPSFQFFRNADNSTEGFCYVSPDDRPPIDPAANNSHTIMNLLPSREPLAKHPVKQDKEIKDIAMLTKALVLSVPEKERALNHLNRRLIMRTREYNASVNQIKTERLDAHQTFAANLELLDIQRSRRDAVRGSTTTSDNVSKATTVVNSTNDLLTSVQDEYRELKADVRVLQLFAVLLQRVELNTSMMAAKNSSNSSRKEAKSGFQKSSMLRAKKLGEESSSTIAFGQEELELLKYFRTLIKHRIPLANETIRVMDEKSRSSSNSEAYNEILRLLQNFVALVDDRDSTDYDQQCFIESIHQESVLKIQNIQS